jgi:hypothetical protein
MGGGRGGGHGDGGGNGVTGSRGDKTGSPGDRRPGKKRVHKETRNERKRSGAATGGGGHASSFSYDLLWSIIRDKWALATCSSGALLISSSASCRVSARTTWLCASDDQHVHEVVPRARGFRERAVIAADSAHYRR